MVRIESSKADSSGIMYEVLRVSFPDNETEGGGEECRNIQTEKILGGPMD